VSRTGSRARADDLGVSVRVRAEQSPRGPRVCVVVGKRAGGAVVRNRQRRRLQHAVVELLPTLPAGTDLVLRGGPALTAMSPGDLRRDLRRTVRRALDRAPRPAGSA
jgi:ribonuclease P protein component